jgi:hypothetical protein
LASEWVGRANMRHEPELLDAIKDCLHDLENVELLSPDDLDIIDQKRSLRQQIAQLEREDSDVHQRAA